jgi:hypothetical protein
VAVIREWPQPTNVHELKSFIGLCSYYRKFIKGFAGICDPLNRLLQKSEDFIWSVECNQAFQTLKHALSSAPILSYPMENGIFTLDTGASGRSIGAVLSQLQSGKERVIGFASRTVTVTGIFLLSQEHSQRDQIYVFKILFCLTVQSHLHQIQYVHMAHGFPPPFCTGKKFLQDENGKIVCSFFFY